KARILKVILEANKTNNKYKMIPQYINSNLGGWKNKNNLEFYVDFETTCSVLNNFESLQNSSFESMIYMIGVGYINNKHKWIYKSFIVKSLDIYEEFRICNEFN